MKLPHPNILLLFGVIIAATLTWILPAGEFDRRTDEATGRRVAVAGSYHHVDAAPVGPFAAAVAIPRGFIEAGEVVGVVLFVGGAWVLVDKLGTMAAVITALVGAFRGRGVLAIPIVAVFFAAMGAVENMQEEIIPLVPALLLLGAGLGIDAVAVVAMTAGAAMIGSAFGPTNPFQAGIALKLAQLGSVEGAGLRTVMLIVGVAGWTLMTMRHVAVNRAPRMDSAAIGVPASHDAAVRLKGRHLLILLVMLLPIAAYVYGALRLDWSLNELSGGFVIAAIAAGLIGRMSLTDTMVGYIEGMQALLPSAVLIGLARSISLVLADGRVVDTILYELAAPLAHVPALVSGLLMVPVHLLVHIAVPSVSGHAALTLPLLVPLADLLGMSRQVPVLAYQTGAGLMELFTPTNGALMAVLLAAKVPYQQWMRFAVPAALVPLLAGIAGIVYEAAK